MKSVNDHFYIQRVKAGDIHAFSGIVSKYQSMVLTVIRKMVDSQEDAEDITQMDNQSIDAISQISQLSVSNVKVKLHRIRKKLAVEINKLMQNENR